MLVKGLPGLVPYSRPVTICGGHRFMRAPHSVQPQRLRVEARELWDPQAPGMIPAESELQRAQSVLGVTHGRMKRTNMPLEGELPPLQWTQRHR